MARNHAELLETHINGPDTRLWSIKAEECPALRQRQIAHLGTGEAAVPYRIVRTRLSGAYFHGSLQGEGRMLIDGQWRPHRAGMASLAPAHVLHAFHAVPSHRWGYCWVRYTPASPRSMIHAMAPIIGQFDCRALGNAIMGLYHEMQSRRDMATAALWLDLIETYVDRFAEPWRREERLLTVWSAVRDDLSRPWRLNELAALAGVSGEHFRRLCQGCLGRSPMQQLATLRVQHAAHQLATTTRKLAAIAEDVGYRNPFAFSNVFTKVTGLRPSSFRHRQSVASGRSRSGASTEVTPT